MLEFKILGDRNNFIDLQRTRLEIVARVVQFNGNVLQIATHATEAAQRDTPYLVNKPFSSSVSECTRSLNGKKNHKLMPILPIRVSLRPNFHKVMMQRKHGWFIKVFILKIIYQVLMVLGAR